MESYMEQTRQAAVLWGIGTIPRASETASLIADPRV